MNNYEINTCSQDRDDLRIGLGGIGSGFGFLPGIGFGRPGIGIGGIGAGLPFLTGFAAGALLRPRSFPYPYAYPPYPYYPPYPPYPPYPYRPY